MNPELPFIIFGGLSMAGIAGWLLRPLVVSLGRRLEGRAGDPALEAEVLELRERLGELDGVHQRLAEVEERLEFAERLLAGGREQEQMLLSQRKAER